MGKCKTKAIQTELGTFRHNQAYPGIIQTYSGTFRTLCCVSLTYLEPLYIQNQKHIENPAYAQPRYIQNPGTFSTLAYSKLEAYSELCQTSTMKRSGKLAIIIFINHNYLFLQHKLATFSPSWNKYHGVTTPEIVILCKKLQHDTQWG